MEFTAWPKTPRLFRDAVITEKIDGTNAAVIVRRLPDPEEPSTQAVAEVKDETEPFDTYYEVGAQSRSRLITPEADNFGFASWIRDNALGLVARLGEGTHFGEWWGSGIQRGYGLTGGERRFSLFNVHRYADVVQPLAEDEDGAPYPDVPGLGVVPVLSQHTFDTVHVLWALSQLRENGSQAAPGFDRPEGVVVFHSASRTVFKALIENDNTPKGT